MSSAPPLVAHVIHRLGLGGLENGLVNLINGMDPARYRHAVVSLTDASEFRERIRRKDVEVHCLGKRPGKDLAVYGRIWRLMRRLRPAILHTRNLGALDAVLPARLAGVRCHVHGLHGWDVTDLHGTNARYRLMRRALDPFTTRYIALSRDLQRWLHRDIGIAAPKIEQIYNGVDLARFTSPTGAALAARRARLPSHFAGPSNVVLMWVGRFEPVKDPRLALDAFARMCEQDPVRARDARLVMVGAGSLEAELRARIEARGLADRVWLPGARDDVADLLGAADVYLLTSLNEGISNTILEAMASGLPVVATRVGGNPELVTPGESGELVPPREPAPMADSLLRYVTDVAQRQAHGRAGRLRCERDFDLAAMIDRYADLYDACVRTG